MNKIKYIMVFCIMFIGLLIIGESHIFYLESFSNEYSYTTLYMQKGITSEEMISDIITSSKENEVEVFTIKTKHRDNFIQYDIFGTDGVESFINAYSNIYEKNYSSLFLGNISFRFNEFKNIEKIENEHIYFVIGNKEGIYQFKMSLIDKYAGNHPKEGYKDKESKYNTIGIWILIICVTVLLTLFNIILQKKENVIRISMGDSVLSIILKNVIIDVLIFTVTFLVIIGVLSKHTYVFFNFKISLIFFSSLLIVNGLLYFSIYFYEVKEAFSNSKSSKKILSLNYGLKIITSIITIIIISSNIASIVESYNLYRQKNFFKNRSDYYYINFAYPEILNSDGSYNNTLEDTARVLDEFHRKFFDKFNATLIKKYDYLEYTSVLINKNGYNYLSREIPELNESELDKSIYLILPITLKHNKEMMGNLRGIINDFNYYLNKDYGVIYYNSNVNLIGIDEDYLYGSCLVKNPVIIFNNMSKEQIVNQKNNVDESILRLDAILDTMYKISSNEDWTEFDNFLTEHNLQYENVYINNTYEKYKNSWIIAKRVLYINMVFSVLVLILEMLIIASIIKLEYDVNAIELSVKKIMGYSMLGKNNKIIMLSLITTLISILISMIIGRFVEIKQSFYVIYGGVMIFILELIIITFYIYKIEKSKIQKILKGGNL